MNRDYIADRLRRSTVGRWASGMSREERTERGDHDLNPGMAKPTELVQAAVLFYALTYVLLNFIADILYTVLNPRIRL